LSIVPISTELAAPEVAVDLTEGDDAAGEEEGTEADAVALVYTPPLDDEDDGRPAMAVSIP
jgi:hypothetical protein